MKNDILRQVFLFIYLQILPTNNDYRKKLNAANLERIDEDTNLGQAQLSTDKGYCNMGKRYRTMEKEV